MSLSMSLRLHNTLTRTKDVFTPLDAANVRMYVCGPTVYDFAHIGNARPAIVFDVLYRLLRHAYGPAHVTYVRNITDVDDKINERALRDFPGLPLNQAIRTLTETTERQYHEDVDALGCLRPTIEPRATEFILPRADGKTDMVTLIGQLVARGHAYQAGGEVLFDTQSMPDYGLLSGRRLEDQQAGARVAVDAHKKHPTDFVLWKQSAADEPGWDSPWGRGRPGWHIECSAMSAAHLGQVFDIHGGGLDLIFPHHENEIAQSRCAHGTPVMANVWMHNGFLQVEGEKMSKSLGNFFTIRDLLADWPGEVLRFNMLRTHYRQPIDWTVASLKESQATIKKWRDALRGGCWTAQDISMWPKSSGRFWDALSDDLNTPLAITELHKLFDWARRFKNDLAHNAVPRFYQALDLLGLSEVFPEGLGGSASPLIADGKDEGFSIGLAAGLGAFSGKVFASAGSNFAKSASFPSRYISPDVTGQDLSFIIPRIELAKLDGLIDARNAARAAKNFAESDRIRDDLLAKGIVLKDGPGGTTWEVKR
jgi:cysteinyl-tRNA synthetase